MSVEFSKAQKEKPDLIYAFGLKPEKAIEYFKSKGYTFSWNWQDTWQEAHAKAFTVAKAMRMDILQDIRESVQKALDDGITLRQFQKDLTPKLQAKGWWGKKLIGDAEGGQTVQLGSPRRLATIYQVNMQTAYMAGRYKDMMDNVEDRPYWQYVAVLDAKTRPAHRALHGKVFRYDDPFWKSFYPPNGWNCRCRVRALSAADVKERGLEISEGGGSLREEEVLVSQRTGEEAKVTVYRDPKTGLDVYPDAGWSYNPGEAAWFPNLDKYDYGVAKKWVEGGITGPDFAAFFTNKLPGYFPVAVLSTQEKELLGSKSQAVLLSSESLAKQLEAHPDMTLKDYRMIPEIVAQGEVYQQGEERLIYLWSKGTLYRASLKRTDDRLENYFLSLFKTTDKKADKEVRRKYKQIKKQG